MRDIIHNYYDNLSKLAENGEIVEIDESKFIKSKPKCGIKVRPVKYNGWVVGITEMGTKNNRVIIVQNRNGPTMLAIAKKYISTKSKLVISDEWKSYKCLRRNGYKIESDNHSKDFVKKEPRFLISGNEKITVKVHKHRKYGSKELLDYFMGFTANIFRASSKNAYY